MTRREADFYPTPYLLADELAKVLSEHTGGKRCPHVLEPSAGSGAFISSIEKSFNKPIVYAVDPYRNIDPNLGHCCFYKEKLEDHKPKDYDVIIGNPPFSLAQEHVEICLKKLTPGGICGLLLRLSFLESKKRIEFWKQHPPAYVYVLSERPSFTGGGTDKTAYAFYIWEEGFSGETVLRFLSWKGE